MEAGFVSDGEENLTTAPLAPILREIMEVEFASPKG
jgi:hypothetical protein